MHVAMSISSTMVGCCVEMFWVKCIHCLLCLGVGYDWWVSCVCTGQLWGDILLGESCMDDAGGMGLMSVSYYGGCLGDWSWLAPYQMDVCGKKWFGCCSIG